MDSEEFDVTVEEGAATTLRHRHTIGFSSRCLCPEKVIVKSQQTFVLVLWFYGFIFILLYQYKPFLTVCVIISRLSDIFTIK
jgi:hypothetical protein